MPRVFFNEFHYDNDGADTGERIEVRATAGADLSAWSVVLYSGNGGGAYGTIPLTGADASDSVGGFAHVVLDATGLQNGSPDGLALVDAAGEVVEFLTYEGTLTAADGPAAGLT